MHNFFFFFYKYIFTFFLPIRVVLWPPLNKCWVTLEWDTKVFTISKSNGMVLRITILRCGLDTNDFTIMFSAFFFFFFSMPLALFMIWTVHLGLWIVTHTVHARGYTMQETLCTVYVMFTHCSYTVHGTHNYFIQKYIY